MENIREDHMYFYFTQRSNKTGLISTKVFGVEKEIAKQYVEGKKKPIQIYCDTMGVEYSYNTQTKELVWKYPFIKKGLENKINKEIKITIIAQGLCDVNNLHIAETPGAIALKTQAN